MKEREERDEGLVEENGAEKHGSSLHIRLVQEGGVLVEHLLHVESEWKWDSDQLHLVVADTRHQACHFSLFFRNLWSGLFLFVILLAETGFRQPR